MVPSELWLYIFYFLDQRTLVSCKRTCTYFRELVSSSFKPSTEPFKTLIRCAMHISIGIHMQNNPKEVLTLRDVSMSGSMELIKYAIEVYGYVDWEMGLMYSCYGGHIEAAKYFILKGASNMNCALRAAARSGSLDMVKLIMRGDPFDKSSAFIEACKYGHPNIVKYLYKRMKKGSSVSNGLSIACYGGHMEVVEYLMPFASPTALNLAAISAIKSDNVTILLYLIKNAYINQECCIFMAEALQKTWVIKLLQSE